jgi:hypothetical protein
MTPQEYKLSIDFEDNEIYYTDLNSGHGKPIKITYKDLNESPKFLDKFTGRDAYLLGTLYASKALGEISFVNIKPKYKLLTLVSILFSTIMLASNILSTKLITFFGMTITGAMLVYPFSYIFDYIITDVYGYQNARRVIISTFISLIIFDISILLLIIMPPSPYWHLQKEFIDVFGRMLRTFASSTIAFSITFFVSSYILQKSKSSGTLLFKRIFRSILISEIIDTGLFCCLAFGGSWPFLDIAKFIVISYFTKVTYELFVYKIITKPIIERIKNVEKLDTVDWNTNFTPFSWDVNYNESNNIYSN